MMKKLQGPVFFKPKLERKAAEMTQKLHCKTQMLMIFFDNFAESKAPIQRLQAIKQQISQVPSAIHTFPSTL